MKRVYGLLFRFTVIFSVFTLIAIAISAIAAYKHQTEIYHQNQEARIKELTDCLEDLIVADGYEFRFMQEYFLENHEKIIIPYDYDGDYGPAREHWEEVYQETYNDNVFDELGDFHKMPEEAKLAFATYKYEQWLSTFESFGTAFGMEYVYYLVPTGHKPDMYYVFDGLRTEKVVDGQSIMEFDYDVEVPVEEYPKLWEAWDTGMSPDGYDVYDNQYGQTYGYYQPVYVDGDKIGVVCADIAVDKVNRGIIRNTLRQVLVVAAVLIVCIFIMLSLVGNRYIRKIKLMEDFMVEYAETKDVGIAKKFDSIKGGRHEITMLSAQTAAMIREMENYIENLTKTTRELTTTKVKAEEMSELAHKDALTGIRNKTAYDKEINNIEWKLATNEPYDFGIAMIDLNFLKRINDTFGHEQGNVAIKRLCMLVCNVFEHSPVFRIGGDEFAVILRGRDLDNIDNLIAEFRGKMKEMEEDKSLEPWEKISAAIGVAIYSEDIDSSVSNVFKRADKAMYDNKREMKAERT